MTGGPKTGPIFGVIFGPLLGFKMGSKIDPKLVQNLTFLGSVFGSLFLEVLELFGCLLGAFLGFLRFSWEVSGPKNVKKLMVF